MLRIKLSLIKQKLSYCHYEDDYINDTEVEPEIIDASVNLEVIPTKFQYLGIVYTVDMDSLTFDMDNNLYTLEAYYFIKSFVKSEQPSPFGHLRIDK